MQAFQQVIDMKLDHNPNDLKVLSNAAFWLISLQSSEGKHELARQTYNFALNLPDNEYKSVILTRYAELTADTIHADK